MTADAGRGLDGTRPGRPKERSMAGCGAIDVVVFPFTPDTKAGAYERATVLKNSLMHLGIWDREFTAGRLIEQMDAAGVEKALLCAQAGGSWEVSYEYTKAMCDEAPGRIVATAGIDPRDVAGGGGQLEPAGT